MISTETMLRCFNKAYDENCGEFYPCDLFKIVDKLRKMYTYAGFYKTLLVSSASQISVRFNITSEEFCKIATPKDCKKLAKMGLCVETDVWGKEIIFFVAVY